MVIKGLMLCEFNYPFLRTGFTFDANDKSEFFYNPYSMSCFLTKYQKLEINALQCYWAQGNSTIKYVQGALKREEIAPKVDILIISKNILNDKYYFAWLLD